MAETERCMLYESCPSLGPEEGCLDHSSSTCISSDGTCEFCGVPGSCADDIIGIYFVDSEDQCLQTCKDTQVRMRRKQSMAMSL